MAGHRVEAAATSDLWAETSIQNGSFTLQPVMTTGQSKLDVILEAVRAECPHSLFFFDKSGNPV
jgi:hypothetical protein